MIQYVLLLQYLKIEGILLNFIIKNFDTNEIERLFNGGVLDLQFKYGIFDDKSLNIFYDINLLNEAKKYVENIIRLAKKEKIQIISFYDKEYPDSLREIPSSPIILYAKGNLDLLKNEKILACVGTRSPNELTLKTIKESISTLAKSNIVIASGLALGVDAFSHECAINYKTKTIAILGNGLDTIYPKKNIQLAKDILKNDGLLISEYPPKSKIEKSNFVERNRLISGISNGIVIFEAEQKSGTLHTARFALKQGKKIFCPVYETHNSAGVLKLLESKSAKPFNSIKTVIEDVFLLDTKLINIKISIDNYNKLLQISNSTSKGIEEVLESLIDKVIRENEL